MGVRRVVGQCPNVYAWVVSPSGMIRSIIVRSGCDGGEILEYDGNKPRRGTVYDVGQFAWRITSVAREGGWLTLEEAYRWDSRSELSAPYSETDVRPAGYVEYLRWADAGAVGRVPVENQRDDPRDLRPKALRRKVQAAFVEENLPSVVLLRRQSPLLDALRPPKKASPPDLDHAREVDALARVGSVGLADLMRAREAVGPS